MLPSREALLSHKAMRGVEMDRDSAPAAFCLPLTTDKEEDGFLAEQLNLGTV
jgi:hypothetical protein